MARYGSTTLVANQWYYVTGVYNAATQTMDVYLNGVLDDGTLLGSVTASQQNSTQNVNIGLCLESAALPSMAELTKYASTIMP